MEIFKLFGTIMVDNDKANESISKTEKNADTLGTKLLGGIKTAAKWAAGIAIAATAVATAIGVTATNAAIDFEKQMANVGTLLDDDVKGKLNNLGNDVKNMSKQTGLSLDVLTDGLYQVVSAFGETAENSAQLEVASKAASAGNATVTDSVNLLSAVTKGYGDTSEEAMQKASDLSFMTVKLGQTSFPELAASMGKLIPLASTMKISQEEVFGAMATLTGVTGNTAEVTTQLRSTVQGFLQPSTDMTEALSNLGYENGQVALESEGLEGILKSLRAEVDDDEVAFSNLFGSVEAKNAVLALTGAQADDFSEKVRAMGDAAGSTEAAFEKQQETVSATIGRIRAQFNVWQVELGEKFLPVLNSVLNWFEGKMPQIETIAQNVFDAIGSAVEWATSKFTQMKEFWDRDGTAILDRANETFTPIRDIVVEVFTTVASFIGDKLSEVKAFWDENGAQILQAAQNAFNGIMAVIEFVMPAILFLIEGVWANIQGVFNGALNIIIGLVKVFAGLFTGDWSKLWEGIKQLISGALTFIWNLVNLMFLGRVLGIFRSFAGAGRNIISGFVSAIRGFFTNVGASIQAIVTRIQTAIVGAFTGARNRGESIVNAMKAAMTGAFTAIQRVATTIFNNVRNAMVNPIQTARDRIKTAIDTITGFFSNLSSKLKIEIPRPKLPRFSIQGGFDLLSLPPKVPSFGIDWYAKGAVFTKPTIFNTPGGLKGFGEAGPEAALPLTNNVLGTIGSAIAATIDNTKASGITQNITFNSPEPLDANEIIKKQRQLQRQLALEF